MDLTDDRYPIKIQLTLLLNSHATIECAMSRFIW